MADAEVATEASDAAPVAEAEAPPPEEDAPTEKRRFPWLLALMVVALIVVAIVLMNPCRAGDTSLLCAISKNIQGLMGLAYVYMLAPIFLALTALAKKIFDPADDPPPPVTPVGPPPPPPPVDPDHDHDHDHPIHPEAVQLAATAGGKQTLRPGR